MIQLTHTSKQILANRSFAHTQTDLGMFPDGSNHPKAKGILTIIPTG